MRIRNRSYAAAFAASVVSLPPSEALQQQTPLLGVSFRQQQQQQHSLLLSCKATDVDDRIKIQRKTNGAPVVDSVLLQFVSQQQSQVVYNQTTSSSSNNPQSKTLSPPQYQETTETIKEKLKSQNDPTTKTTTAAATTTTSQWMLQFQSDAVAQTLLETTDLENADAARLAGDAVERYCMVRTARSKIRRFLKERENLWADKSALLSTTTTFSLEEEQQQQQQQYRHPFPSYGLKDVLKVLQEYGLTGNDIAVLLKESPNLALRVPLRSSQELEEAEALEETLERSFKGLLMGDLGLRRYDARKVLRSCPGLLSVRGSQSSLQVFTIMSKLGVSASSMARDKASLHVLLSRSPAGLFRLVAFLSSTAVKLPMEQIGPLLRKKSGKDLMDALLPVPTVGRSWSSSRMERQETIDKTYARMTQNALLLQQQIGTSDLSSVVSSYPQVLLLDAPKQILPVCKYLMGGLGIWKDDLSKLLQAYPTLLGTKIEDLETVVTFVLQLGVEEDDLAGIFRAFPGLFSLEVEQMQQVVDFLERIGVQDIGSFVTKLPPILGYSVRNELQPKWDFLKTVCLQPEFELAQFPAYFSYPLERVIKTRFNYLAYKGISIRFVSMRIDTVLRFGDVDFATKVAMDNDDGEAYRRFGSQRGNHQNQHNNNNQQQRRRRHLEETRKQKADSRRKRRLPRKARKANPPSPRPRKGDDGSLPIIPA